MSQPSSYVVDADLCQYVFLALEVEGEGGENRRLDVTRIRHSLARAAGRVDEFLGVPPRSFHYKIPEGDGRQEDEDIYPDGPVDWIDNKQAQRAGFAHIRRTNGVLLLQLAFEHAGQSTPRDWSDLRDARWQPDAELKESCFFLGETTCYAGHAADAKQAELHAEEVLVRPSKKAWPVRLVNLPFGGWLFDRPGLPDEIALFYPKQCEAGSGPLMNELLPQLALFTRKIVYQFKSSYDKVLRREIERREKELLKVLKEAPHLRRTSTGSRSISRI